MKHWEAHPEYVEGCFGCKGLTLSMNAGDADSRRVMTNKAFNRELGIIKLNCLQPPKQHPKYHSQSATISS